MVEPSGGRLPPQAVEAEQSVLGSMLLSKEAIGKAVELLDESCFYRVEHQQIFQAIVGLYDANKPVDLITLTQELKKRRRLKEVGGRVYLMGLLESTPTAANLEYYARIVLEKATLRKLADVSTGIVTQCYQPEVEADSLLDKAEQQIFNLSESRMRGGFVHIGEILPHTFEAIEEFHKREGFVTGIPSGFKELDSLTSGFQKSDLVIIAGRPSMGKTAFSLSIAQYVAIKEKLPVAIFSLEMSKSQLVQRMLCSEARVDSHLLRTGRLPNRDWPRLSIAVGPLSEAPLFIDDTPAIGVLEMRAKARRLKSSQNIGMVILDYLQLMQGPKGAENRQQEISTICRSLKGLAKELDVPVLALSQLSRQVEVRGKEHRPQLSDLRESGAIEQDADLVLFIYRPEVYGILQDRKGNPLQGVAEIIIGKQRNGPTGSVKLAFIDEYAKFENPAFLEEEPSVEEEGSLP